MRSRLVALGTVLAAAAVFAALAAASTTVDPGNAPNGTHLQSGDSTCTVNGLDVSCSTYELAGVGNADATANLSVTYSATVVCINGGGKPSDSQHQGTSTSSTSSGQLEPKNGRLAVPGVSVSAPSEQEFLSQQSCSNPNWTPTIPGGITLQSFTYTLTFDGFGGT